MSPYIKFFCIIILTATGCYFFYSHFIYYGELHKIEDSLNETADVNVMAIWGHEDITLEEVSARVKLKNKGELVLDNLNSNDNRYPEKVIITEIGGYSFSKFTCSRSLGIGPSIDIGTKSDLGKIINIEFKTAKDVITNYDKIYHVIDSLAKPKKLIYFSGDKYEQYLLIKSTKSKDQDPIFNLDGIENEFEFAKTLKWKCKECTDF